MAQQSDFPFINLPHYKIRLLPEFVDSLYQEVKTETIHYLKKTLNSQIREEHLCFEELLSDSVYYNTVFSSALNIPMMIKHDSIPDSLIINPAWKDHDPNKIIPLYRYSSYQILEHQNIVPVKTSTKEADCLATIRFSKLYEHEDFLLGEIFLEWKEVNMDVKKFRLLCFELRDWKKKGELRLGNPEEIMVWDW